LGWQLVDHRPDAKNRASLEKALKPNLAKATKQSARAGRKGARRAGSSPGPPRGSSRADLREVRAWAKSNGHPVSDGGRVSAAVQQAYDAADRPNTWELRRHRIVWLI
jgi:Lsr2